MKFTHLILLSTFAFSQALANSEFPKLVLESSQKFEVSMNQCPEKIWADYSWKEFDVYFVYSTKNTVYKWNGSTNHISTFDPNDLSDRSLNGFYDFFELDGRKSMSIKADQDYAPPFLLATHEGFHYLAQENWTPPGGARGTVYPLDFTPRYIRKMLFNKLFENLTENNATSLEEAKYWYDQWAFATPEELTMTADGYEGTAKYVETMANVISKHGCDITDEILKAELISEVKTDYFKYLNPEDPSLDGEGYAVGGLASIILRLNRKSLDWQKEIANGTSPLEVLLNERAPLSNGDNVEEKQKYETVISGVNTNMGKLIDADISRMSNPKYVRVQTSFGLVQSNFSPKFFASIESLPGLNLFPLAEGLTFVTPDKKEQLQLGVDAVIISYYSENPCNDSFVLVHEDNIYQESDASGENTVWGVTSAKVNGLFKAQEHTNPKGLRFLCWGQES